MKPAFHTPYDGSSQPFTIGLSQLDEKDWIETDENLGAYLREKASLYKAIPDKVVVSDEGTEDAQREVLELLKRYLPQRYPDVYQCTDEVMRIGGFGSVALTSPQPAIHIAAQLVQEDLVLMRRGADGWRLGAASLCFPSAWNLLEKFKKPLGEIHAPVPGFGKGTRNGELIERMFDNLSPARLVLRWNWSLHGDAVLYHPHSHSGSGSRFGEGDLQGKVVLRLERQTLRKLPISGDILFTIRIHLNPIEMLEGRAHSRELAASLNEQLLALSIPQAQYKGVVAERDRLSARLRQISGA